VQRLGEEIMLYALYGLTAFALLAIALLHAAIARD
jgi:hypothetical protein